MVTRRSSICFRRAGSWRVVLGEVAERAAEVLQAIEHVLHLAGDLLDLFDLSRQRLQQMQRAPELGDRRALVLVDELERAGGGLDHLPRVAEDGLLAAQRFLFTGIERGRGDLVDLILEQIQAQRAIALRVASSRAADPRRVSSPRSASRVASRSAPWPPYSSTSSR